MRENVVKDIQFLIGNCPQARCCQNEDDEKWEVSASI